MDLKLYSNIPITKDYNVVVNNATIHNGETLTAFEKLLSSKLYDTISNIDFYLTFPTGQLILDKDSLDSDNHLLKQYNFCNYIEFQLYENDITMTNPPANTEYYLSYQKGNYLPFKVYAFIDNLKLMNDVYILNYTIDYMHTYMRHIVKMESHIIRYNQQYYVRYKTGASLYPKLKSPLDYKSIDGNVFKYYDNTAKVFKTTFTDYKFGAIVQLQLYNLSQQGEQTEREIILTDVCATQYSSGSWTIINNDLNGLISTLNFLFLHQGDSAYQINNKYYQIMHIYFINNQLVDNTLLQETFLKQWQDVFGTGKYLTIFKIDNQTITQKYIFSNKQYTTTKSQLSHILSFGTMGHQIPFEFENDNLINKIEIISLFDGFSFNMFLKYKETTINITSDFEIFYPYTVDDASAREMDKFTRYYNENQLQLTMYKSGANVILGTIGGAASMAAAAATGGASAAIMGIGGAGSIVGSFTNFLFTAEDTKQKREKNNAQLYQTSTMSVASVDNFLNVYYGIVFMFMNNSTFADGNTNYDAIINFDDVNREIKDLGFVCNFKIDKDILFNNLETDNVLYFKFNDTHINGYFDNDTNEILTTIFNKGFKLYNTYNYLTINNL